MSRKRRTLRPEEEDIWKRVADTTVPMHPTRTDAAPIPGLATPPKPAKTRDRAPIEPFSLGTRPNGSLRNDLAPSISQQLSHQPIQMDGKAFGRMKRGKLVPEGRIDLHGMTLAQAHPALKRFVLNAHAQGKRLVLVITGKGKSRDDTGPIPERKGVLKHQVPQWLRMAPLGPIVLQVAQAHLKHGGSGAYYVYLRRTR